MNEFETYILSRYPYLWDKYQRDKERLRNYGN